MTNMWVCMWQEITGQQGTKVTSYLPEEVVSLAIEPACRVIVTASVCTQRFNEMCL